MRRKELCLRAALGLVLTMIWVLPAHAAPSPYPAMAPIEQYLSATRADEIALARSAGPPSISRDAKILTFGAHGYEVAATGKNGFVCYVERAWSNDFSDREFWNPKIRAPFCMNPAAARSVLPEYLKRTQWALSGASRAQMLERAKAAVAANEITAPDSGAMCYMLSKHGYLNDDAAGPWRPHVMFFLPRTAPAQWGANRPDSPMIAVPDDVEPITVFLVPVSKWSDGTPFTKSPPHKMH